MTFSTVVTFATLAGILLAGELRQGLHTLRWAVGGI